MALIFSKQVQLLPQNPRADQVHRSHELADKFARESDLRAGR